MNIPKNLRYTRDHEWADKKDDIITIGITDFAQNSLGDIVFVELPEVGSKLESKQAFGVVESIKSVSDLYSPVAGEIIECNNTLEDEPEAINTSPYESWLVKIKVAEPSAFNDLMGPEDYEKRCQEEI